MHSLSKFLSVILIVSLFSALQAKKSKSCLKYQRKELEGKRDVKFLMVLMRHGSRSVNDQSMWNKYFKSFHKKDYGKLSDVGKNQALLGGQNLKANYPKFLKGIKPKNIRIEAKKIERTEDTAKGFADGLIINFRTLQMKNLTNLNSFPPWYIYNRKKNYCFKYTLTEDLIYHLRHTNTMAKTNPNWKVHLTCPTKSDCWEDHTDHLCTKVIKDRTAWIDKHDPMLTETVKAVKRVLKTTPQFSKMLKKTKRSLNSLTWENITDLADWCNNVNTIQKKQRCNAELMGLISIIYSYKFYGINSWKQNQIFGSTFGKKYTDILSSMLKKGSKTPKVHLFGKSDSLIAPFYELLGLTPKRKSYIKAFDTVDKKSKLPKNPQFADTLVTEISKKGNTYFVRLIRDGIPIKIPACEQYECELNWFIKKTKDITLSFPVIKKKCGVYLKPTALKSAIKL